MTAVPERPLGAKSVVSLARAPASSPASPAKRERPAPLELVGVRIEQEVFDRVEKIRPLCGFPGQIPSLSRALAYLVHEGLEALESGEVTLSDLSPRPITPGRGRRALW